MSCRDVLLTFAVSAVALAPLGCGSSSSDSTNPQAPPMTKAAFVKAANSICVTSRERDLRAVPAVLLKFEQEGKTRHEAELDVFSIFIVSQVHTRLDRVRALGVPTGDEDQVNAILNAVEGVIDRAKSDPENFVKEQAQFEHPLHNAQALANQYGITSCVQP